jgi:hypothetical protein
MAIAHPIQIRFERFTGDTGIAPAKPPRLVGPDEKPRLIERAKQLLEERHAVLVAHYYVHPDLQDLAQSTGGTVSDSLEMARFGRDHPSKTLVVDSRAPMVVVGTLAVLGIYGVGRVAGGRIVGLIATALALGSPLAQEYLPQVLPEGMLILSMTGCLTLAALGMRNGRLPFPWTLGVGLLLGLGLAAKLTATLGVLALLGWSLLAVVHTSRSHRPKCARPRAASIEQCWPPTRHGVARCSRSRSPIWLKACDGSTAST